MQRSGFARRIGLDSGIARRGLLLTYLSVACWPLSGQERHAAMQAAIDDLGLTACVRCITTEIADQGLQTRSVSRHCERRFVINADRFSVSSKSLPNGSVRMLAGQSRCVGVFLRGVSIARQWSCLRDSRLS